MAADNLRPSRPLLGSDGVIGSGVKAAGAARQIVTTWWVPEQYAGQTTATLSRITQYAERTGRPVDLLTFSALHEHERALTQLRERGVDLARIRLRNLFDDLRSWEQRGELHTRLATLPRPTPAVEEEIPVASEERGPHARRSYSASGELTSSEVYRDDGSVLCRDYPVVVGGGRQRYQQFFHRDGSESVLLSGTWPVYYLWLDAVVGDEPTLIVNESKSTARFMSRYHHPRASVVHVFHESHLADSALPYSSELQQEHRRVIPHLDRFDAVVCLTGRQRLDLSERFGPVNNLHAVPNAGPPAATRQSPLASPGRGRRGVVVATLKPLKRITHAIEAVAAVRRGGQRVTLDIYGRDAGAGAELEQKIRQTDTADTVRLRGFTTDAAQVFAAASFSVMTSRTEGQSLVLLESMAGGCVPISYDIRYGPAEVIADGETGFLVPAGDIESLAETIDRFLALPGKELRRLRNNCRERLAAFSPDEVHRRWLEVQAAAATASRRRLTLSRLTVSSFAFTAVDEELGFAADVTADWDVSRWLSATPPPMPTAALLITGRQGKVPYRIPLQVSGTRTAFAVSARFDPAQVSVDEGVGDVHVEVTAEGTSRRERLHGPAEIGVPGGRIYATAYGNVSLRR